MKRMFLVVLVLMALIAAPSLTSAAPDLAQDLVAFASNGAIWTVWGDGTHLLQITPNDYSSADPALSPDGRLLSYIQWIEIDDDSWITQIRIRNLTSKWDQAIITNLNTHGYDCFPCWSPDGKQIAFARVDYSQDDSGFSCESKIMKLSTINSWTRRLRVSRLTNSGEGVWESVPAWSPDGKQIAYLGDERHRYKYSIWVANLKTGTRKEVIGDPDGNVNVYRPTWSPDSRWLAFNATERGASWQDDKQSLNLASAATTNPTPTIGEPFFVLNDHLWLGYFPSWSVGSGWVYFEYSHSFARVHSISEIHTIDPLSGLGDKGVLSRDFSYCFSVSRNPFYRP